MHDPWIEFAARGAALLVSAFLLLLVLRRLPARLRGAVLLATLTGLVLLPVATWLLPRWDAPVLPAEGSEITTVEEAAPSPANPRPVIVPASEPVLHGLAQPILEATPPAAERPAEAPTPTVAPASAPSPAPRLQTSVGRDAPKVAVPTNRILWIWLGGVILVLVPWIVGLLRTAVWARAIRRLDRTDVRIPDGLRVGVHPAVGCPLTVGLFRPVVLVPETAASWPPDALEAALLHEAAHARRRDVPATAIARLACAWHWFNPLAWMAAAQMRRDSELACDEAVLASGMAPSTFAETLVTLARSARTPRLYGAAAGWGCSGLERRIEVVLRGAPRSRRARRAPRLVAALALGVAFLGAATLHPTRTLHAEEEPADAPSETVLTVGPEGCDHTTIQAAIDAAAPGSLIRIAAGTYAERVSIPKALTLEGAGWSKTTIVSPFRATRRKGAYPYPTIAIGNSHSVALRALRISMTGRKMEGSSYSGSALAIDDSHVRMVDCAVIPSPASGIIVRGDSDVVIQRCLVAAIGSTGIAIGGREGGTPKVRVQDCDVRYGHSRCITIGPGCDDVVVEGCRISGSGWHGIRYDGASPTIRRNRITDNVRFGIYASGHTGATVEGNLFADTGLDGVGCWTECADIIQGNTFAHNARAGLAVYGTSSPTVTRNVFVDHPVAVSCSGPGRDPGSPGHAAGLGTVGGNVFWKNELDLSRPDSSDPGNERLDPRLGADYVLADDSPARARGIGATALPPAKSPFPAQAEEAAAERRYQDHLTRYGDWKRVARTVAPPRHGSLLERDAQAKRRSAAWTLSREWAATIQALGASPDAAVRTRTVQELATAISGDDVTRRLAGLLTVRWLDAVPYDRDDFRTRILPYVQDEDPYVRRAAREALVHVKPDPADLPMWLEEAQTADRSNAETTAEYVVLLADGIVRGKAADAILHLLRDGTDIKRAFVIRGLQKADEFDPRVEARLIEIVRSVPAHDYDSAYYFHLITPRLDPKSDAVLDVMLDRADEGRTSLSTLLRGFSVGLNETQKKRAADRLITLAMKAQPEPRGVPGEVLQALIALVDARHVERLEELAAREHLAASTKALLKRALEAARERP